MSHVCSSLQAFADLCSVAVQKAFTEADFLLSSELQEKQDELNQKTRRLRDEGIALAKAKERLHELQAKAREEHELEQKNANLNRSNAELKSQLSQSNGQLANGMPDQVVVGEADKGLDFDGLLPLVEQLFPSGEENIDFNGPLSVEQRAFLSSLERAEVVRGRTAAYQQHNADLETRADKLRGMGHELEGRYRKIVSICTGVEVDKVDDMMENLLQAVMSEQKEHVELGKVRDFLKLVRGGDE